MEVVLMREYLKLDWRVPTDVWDRFRDHVQEKFDGLEGRLGREAEHAMQEYADADTLAEGEELLNELLRTAGRTCGDTEQEKTSELATTETTRVQVRVDSVVKDKFRAVVTDSDDSYGVAFARALREYLDGGRDSRVVEKLRRISDACKDVFAEMNPDTDDGLSSKQRKIYAICDRLHTQFTDERLLTVIDDIAGEGDRASAPTRKQYRETITERLDVEPHPQNSDIWIPTEEAKQIAGHATPRVCRLPVSHLDRDEKLRRIQLEAGRQAVAATNNCTRLTATTVREEILECAVSEARTRELLEQTVDGYRSRRKHGKRVLDVDFSAVMESDLELAEKIYDYQTDKVDDSRPSRNETQKERELPAAASSQAAPAAEGIMTDGGIDMENSNAPLTGAATPTDSSETGWGGGEG